MAKQETPYRPLPGENLEIAAWKDGNAAGVVSLPRFWNKYLPRGKGWVPRFLGRWSGRNLCSYITTRHGARLAIEPTSLEI